MFGNVTTNKPRYAQSFNTEDESRHKPERKQQQKTAGMSSVVTTVIIKGSLCEFDHKQREIEDNHQGREEIIKRRTEGTEAR